MFANRFNLLVGECSLYCITLRVYRQTQYFHIMHEGNKIGQLDLTDSKLQQYSEAIDGTKFYKVVKR